MTPVRIHPSTPSDPRTLLDSDALTEPARAWLSEAMASVAVRPNALRVLFPAARRRCGQERLDEHWSVDEAARAVLLTALPQRGVALAVQVAGLFRHGDPAEQRAVLKALPFLDDPGSTPDAAFEDLALTLVREALRGNDTDVLAAALGPYAAARLPDAEYRQAVLKCVFCEIPLARVAGLDTRADRELARMLADFAHERIAAGRGVPADVWPLVAAFEEVADLLAARARLLATDRPDAAADALTALAAAQRPAPTQEEA
ncbi:EboA domain-containing protein [Streptomyces sp. NPDC096132]|uniref:EboA domain-containing protein n=1 Tax=Streptomyces sp. NPDC096132 TaxID=3366075 RepID=UPI003811DEAA